MGNFEEHIFARAKKGIEEIPKDEANDIYALSFYFSAEEDDPRQVTLAVGYNTNARWKECTPADGQQPKWPIASDSDEAKWNYAFWLQEDGEVCLIGETKTDESLRKIWIESLECWWTDKEADEDFDRTLELGDKVMEEFVNLCLRVAARLHNDGLIQKKFGRDVPILIHELEYNDQHAEMTQEANPPGITKEFTQWIANM